MTYRRLISSTVFLMGLFLLVPISHSAESTTPEDDSNFKYKTITTKDGLNFRVPEDMPIQKKDGIVAPMPFDEYMYGKFKKIDMRLEHMETQLQNIEKLLEEMKQSQPKVLKAGGTP